MLHIDPADLVDPSILSSEPQQPIKINILVYPHPVRVSYATVARTIPTLLRPYQSDQTPPHHPHVPAPSSLDSIADALRHATQQQEAREGAPDWVVHLGMADGRKYYALETVAHRDGYSIPDVDGLNGQECGSRVWAEQGCPAQLETGWHPGDVLRRWREMFKKEQQQQQQQQGPAAGMIMSMMTTLGGFGKRRTGDELPTAGPTLVSTVSSSSSSSSTSSSSFSPSSLTSSTPDLRLSSNAGHFLCDFIFYASLSERWREEKKKQWSAEMLFSSASQQQQDNWPEQDQAQQPQPQNDFATTTPSPSTCDTYDLPSQNKPCLITTTTTTNPTENPGDSVSTSTLNPCNYESSSTRGNIAFLHVPGDTSEDAIERGVKVAEAAIGALVGSWEAGMRKE